LVVKLNKSVAVDDAIVSTRNTRARM